MAKQEEAEKRSHPSIDGTCRFEVDQLLRKKGYQIHSRKNKSEARWIKEGVIFKQSEVLLRMDEDELGDAAMMQEMDSDKWNNK